MTTGILYGVGQMTMFDHNGGKGVKIPENLTAWYMDAPLSKTPQSNFFEILSHTKHHKKRLPIYHIGPIGRQTGCLLNQGAM